MGKYIDGVSTAYDGMGIGKRTAADPDNITIALPNAGAVSTDVFRLAKVQGRVELAIDAVEELTIADGATLSVELAWDSDREGAFADSKVIAAFAPSGAADVIAAGGKIALELPESDVEQFVKVTFTASGNLSANNAAIRLYEVAA